VGAFGNGVVYESEEADAADVPTALVPVTLKVYGVPMVRPEISQLVLAVVQVNPPGDEVAV